MKLWIDDVRPEPSKEYRRVYLVEEAISEIIRYEKEIDYLMRDYILGYRDWENTKRLVDGYTITEISCDNDLGEGNAEGYKMLDWLEITHRNYPIHIHSANPVAVERMRAIIERNGWKEVKR